MKDVVKTKHSRHQQAEMRHDDRAQRSPQEQLALLDTRPGESRRERAKLTRLVSAAERKNVAQKPTETPTTTARTRRRASRRAGKVETES